MSVSPTRSIVLTLAVVATAGALRADEPSNDTPGAVYALTNLPAGNAVLVYDRGADATLTPAGAYPTGGTGNGAGLGSQGAVIVSDHGRLLFAVNAGSHRSRRSGSAPTGSSTPTPNLPGARPPSASRSAAACSTY